MKVNMGDECSRIDIYRRTTYHMVKCGFQARQKGYRYLREAVWIAWCEPDVLTSVTKRLYPEVAKRFDTTDKQVERAIRNAIETAWTNGAPEALKGIFQEKDDDRIIRPTNTKVIEMLLVCVRTDMKMEWEENVVEGGYQDFKHHCALFQ